MKLKIALLLLLPWMALCQSESKGTFSTDFNYSKNYGYILQSPENKRDKKPLIVFLHGSGERGADVEKVKVHGPLKYAQTHQLDAYILAPQCPEKEYWDAEVLYRLIQKIQKDNKNIDPQRIYITGLSLGGWGTWDLASKHAELFAAVVPICGFVNRMDMESLCNIKSPIRIFHGVLDDVVAIDYSVNAYKKLKSCNGNVTLTLFDDANHDSWSRVYDNPEIYDWMLAQKKTNQ